ncbi:MAG TPA: PQQ-binding-like beta-propeller repeat protein [Phycisphaerae bacterium]|nr:PQQ-binding-like beta-propeller repeat protein [Phycisphaerae bacterium]
MTSTTRRSVARIRNILLALLIIPAAVAVAAPPVPDFCFVHTSDSHLSPSPVGTAPPKAGDRTVDGLTWLLSEASKPQVLAPLNITTPPPAFIINTGDVTEYGVINKTWDNFEAIVEPFKIPLFITPGNHDNTWTSIIPVMRRRHGSDHYSFDRFGCHFACIDTATPQEPLPVIDKRTLDWLADDLGRLPRDMPVFLFCHHPLSSTEFAKPFEQLRLLQIIERYNVVLLMMGHGHGHRHERWNTIDSVMGGTTSHPHDNIGYNVVYVKDGVLRVVFRYRDTAKPMEVTLQKPIAPQSSPEISILTPKPVPAHGTPVTLGGNELAVRVRAKDGKPARVVASLNAVEETTVPLDAKSRGVFEGRLKLAGLTPGRHFVMVTADFGKTKLDRAEQILVAPPGSPDAALAVLNAGVKAQPLATPDGLIVCTTGGEIVRLTFDGKKANVQELFKPGVEILHAPALVDDRLYVSAAEQGVHCLSLDGKKIWTCDVGAVVYGTPAVDADRVYVADMEGFFHAIDRKTGKLAWSKRHATYSIEMPVLLHGGVLYAGSWENQLFAVNAKDGTLKWKSFGPAAHSNEAKFKSRYYAPADCMPLAIGDRLFVTDRAYQLGSYDLATGEYRGHIAASVAAIGLTADGKGFYARGLSKGLTRYDGEGKPVWSQPDLSLGRFPVAPVEVGGKVFVCSNRGMLTVHDAGTGKELLRYQATPQLHVMAPVAADAEGAAYVAGMDGTVSRIAPAM